MYKLAPKWHLTLNQNDEKLKLSSSSSTGHRSNIKAKITQLYKKETTKSAFQAQLKLKLTTNI